MTRIDLIATGGAGLVFALLWLWQRTATARAQVKIANLVADKAALNEKILKVQRLVESHDVAMKRLLEDLDRERRVNDLAKATIEDLQQDVEACREPGVVRRRLARVLQAMQAERANAPSRDPSH